MSPGLKMILGLVLRGLIQHSAKDKEKGKQNPSVTTSRDSSPRQGSQENEEKGGEN